MGVSHKYCEGPGIKSWFGCCVFPFPVTFESSFDHGKWPTNRLVLVWECGGLDLIGGRIAHWECQASIGERLWWPNG